ncbi:HEPN domain-containing protein [Pinirhizobacter soli]|uniref:HEPN domain-containing protein n=1 Tax=Pinirhizobacter soli TaxID=2786953 RepID=UPI00202A613F|nr:HEPN domain-containing protein [Pinirhizobacter soli]
MAINLANECKQRLHECLVDALAETTVTNNSFLESIPTQRREALDKALPNKTRKDLENYIGEFPLSDFLEGALARDLQITQKFELDVHNIPLDKIKGFEDIDRLAKIYLSEFEALPAIYMFTFPLSKAIGDAIRPLGDRIDLTENIAIVFAKEDFRDIFPLSYKPWETPTIAGIVDLVTNRVGEWSNSIPYMQIRGEGFVGRFTSTTPELDALASLRSICGLAIAERTWRAPYKYSSTQPTAKYYIHAKKNDAWEFLSTISLDRTIAAVIERLVPDDLQGTIKPDGLSNWMKKNIDEISLILKRPKHSSNITLGAQWLFDSYATDDPLLSFISASVVSEILLGDKLTSEKTGVTDLLANRCAYLISESHSERQKALKDFKEIYDVRSRIVHQGKRTLSGDERDKLHTLRWMCARIIQEESKLVRKEKL